MAGNIQLAKISGWLFLLGLLVALINGVAAGVIPSVGVILVGLGLVVGLLAALGMGSITKNSMEPLLIATIALVATGGSGAAFSALPSVGSWLSGITANIGVFVTPIAVILAIKIIWDSAAVRLT